MDRMRLRQRLGAAALALVVLAGAAVALVLGEAHLSDGDIADWVAGLGAWGPLAVAGLMVLHSFVPFPAEFVAFAAGAAFGTLVGTAAVWAGAMIGAALSFWLARRMGRAAVEALLPPRQRATLDGWTAEQGTVALLASRFVPVIAFNLINYAAGLTRVSFWTFLWTTGLGILPLTLLMVHMGATMAELSWPWLIGVSAVGIAIVVILHRVAKRRGWL